MKKGLLFPALILGLVPPAFAGGIFYNSNQSAEYLRTFDRNSSIDNGDIVYYNFAGTPKLRDGWTFNFSDQMIFQRATVQTIGNPVTGDKLYRSNNPALIVPNFYAAYKKDNWAVFGGIETIGATAIREWKDGLPTLDLLGKQMAGYGNPSIAYVMGADAYATALQHGATPAQAQQAEIGAALSSQYFPSSSYLKGSSYYVALRLGGALQVNPWFSIGAVARFVTSRQDIVGSVDGSCTYNQLGHDFRNSQRAVIDVVDNADGASGELGLNFYPADGMVINLSYEMATRLDFKTTVNDGKDGAGMFVNGTKARLDLPQVVRFGLGYQLTPQLRLSCGANAYLESSADFAMLNNPTFGIQASNAYRNTYEESAALEYRFTPKWLFSFGVNLNQIGQNQDSTIDISLPGAHANYMSEGIGFQYEPSGTWKFNLGLAHTAFQNKYSNQDAGDRQLQAAYAAEGVTINPTKQYNKEYFIVAAGIEFHF